MKSPILLLTLDDTLERLFDIVGGVFNIIWSFLCSIIYGLIVITFNLFNNIAQLDILSDGQIKDIYQRVTMIITIVMVFYITFEFVKYVVSPDTISDKEKGAGKVVMRIVIAILLIAFIPSIFDMGMKLQNKILSTNVIPKVVFGSGDYDYKSAGSDFAGNVFKAFYRVNSENCKTTSDCEKAKEKVDEVIGTFKNDMGLAALAKANVKEWLDFDNTIQFDGLLAVVFGGFTFYVIFLYCMDLAVRYVQLIFLQLIAPVAAISYIAPQKDGLLKKWTKQVTTTYLDVFVRIAILCFMNLIVEKLAGAFDFYNTTSNEKQISILLYLFVIAGLLTFVQRVPKMLQELFPSNGGASSIGFGFESKTRFEPLGKSFNAIKKPIAATAGAVAGIARTGKAIKGGKLVSDKLKKGTRFRDKLERGATYATTMARAGAKGAASGYKSGRFGAGKLAAQEAVQGDEAHVAKGGTVLGKTFRGNRYQELKTDIKVKIDQLEAVTKAKESVASAVKNMKVMKTMESYKTDWINRGIGDASTREKAMKDIEKASRVYSVSNRDAAAEAAFNKAIESAVKSVYNINLPTYGPYNGKQQEVVSTIQNLKANMELGSVKWDTVKVAMDEATRISTGREIKLEVPKKDANGNIMHDANNNVITETITKIVGDDASATEFAEKIGDVSDAAEYEVARLKSEETTRMAEANAAESKK